MSTDTTAATAAPARRVLAESPLLRADAIAAHAREHHGVTWPSEQAACEAIEDVFDSVLPFDCGYYPAEGVIDSPAMAEPSSWRPEWRDPERMNCVVASLAASLADCDLERIYGWLPPEMQQK